MTGPCRVMIVDDEPAMREVLQARLERWGYDIRVAATAQEAGAQLAAFDPHVVISDLVLPDATGLDLLEQLRGGDDERKFILITAYGTIDIAVQAIKGGATEFLTKPLDYVMLKKRLEELASERLAASSTVAARPEDPAVPEADAPAFGGMAASGGMAAFGGMVGESAALRGTFERIEAAAASDAPVLVVGESGTGKELVARTIFCRGRRREGPFIVVNAAAIPESLVESELFGVERGAFTGAARSRPGLFEQAQGGTLFLDEITEMPLSLQAKLLRVLEDGAVRRLGGSSEIPCDVRVIAATNRPPKGAVEQGRLRHDLLYRLDVLRVDVPPLRARPEDVPLLVGHFLRDCARRYGGEVPRVSDEALRALTQHPWPGNVRQLRNVVEQAFVLAREGTVDLAQVGLAEPASSGDDERSLAHGIVIPHGLTLAEAERILILETLKRTSNNKAEAARRLGLDVKTVRNKLKTFDPAEGVS